MSIVFLFDLTETVHPVLQKLAQGASLILGHLKPQDEVSVMVFSSHTEVVQGFTTRRVSTEAAIEQAAQKTTVEAFARHIDADINMVRAEMAEIDALIRGIHASRVWSLKGKLGAVRRRLLARGR